VTENEKTDEALMLDYAKGSERAFVELYRRFEPRLYGFLIQRLSKKHKQLASDLFQKTWLNVHAGRNGFDPTKKFSSWLFTIAINALRDHLSLKEERIEKSSLEDFPEPTSLQNQENELMKELTKKDLHTVLDQLPPMQREAILLCELEGFSSSEASAMMNLSDGAVRQLLFRARTALKKLLGGMS